MIKLQRSHSVAGYDIRVLYSTSIYMGNTPSDIENLQHYQPRAPTISKLASVKKVCTPPKNSEAGSTTNHRRPRTFRCRVSTVMTNLLPVHDLRETRISLSDVTYCYNTIGAELAGWKTTITKISTSANHQKYFMIFTSSRTKFPTL